MEHAQAPAQAETPVQRATPAALDTDGLCLLSLDGGGVRGLSSLYILQDIMNRVNGSRKKSGLQSVKPCELFDLIGGTSTGGLIAIMLGRLEMDVGECIEAYKTLSKDIFEKSSWFPVHTNLDIKAKFDSDALENCVAEIVKKKIGEGRDPKAELLNDGAERHCRVFVTATRKSNVTTTVRLKTYDSPRQAIRDNATIVQASRATSAATTFFDPAPAGDSGQLYVDGGFGANNPVYEVWSEAKDIWSTRQDNVGELIKCMVSIGTGHPKTTPVFDKHYRFLTETLVAIATETEKTAERFRRDHGEKFRNARCFRFNVDHGLQNIGLEEYKKLGDIMAATTDYLESEDVFDKTLACEDNLKMKESSFTAPSLLRQLLCGLPIPMTREEKETLGKCQAALFISNPKDDMQATIAQKGDFANGTCQWILRNSAFALWNQSPTSQVLWISGEPGKGKTMLSIFITQKLEAARSRDLAFLYYFCDLSDPQWNNTMNVLRSLIWLLLKNQPELRKHILPDFEVMGKKMLTSTSAFHGLWRIFELMINDPVLKTVYLLLDGLDECADPLLPSFVKRIQCLMNTQDTASRNTLKLLIVSRPTRLFRKYMSEFPHLCLDTGLKEEIDEDVRKFINVRVFDTRKDSLDTTKSKTALETAMLKRSGGTFLWVGFVAKELEDSSLGSILAKMETIPTGLDGIYRRMLDSIENDMKKTAKEIFRWIVTTVRPLTLIEIGAIISCDCPSDVSLAAFVRSQLPRCGDFLKIDDNRVGFVHQSARDYFLKQDLAKDFYVEESEAHFEIARDCLDCLQGDALAEGPLDLYLLDKVTGNWTSGFSIASFQGSLSTASSDRRKAISLMDRLERFPLLAYATIHWPEHARKASESMAEDLFDRNMPFFTNGNSIRDAWWRTYSTASRVDLELFNLKPASNFSLLHLASYFGLDPLVRKVIGQNSSWWTRKHPGLEQVNSSGRTPLMVAAYAGHASTVGLLIKSGANKDSQDTYKRSALMTAAARGHISVLEELTTSNLDARDNEGSSALILAAQNGHAPCVRLLSEKGADLEIKDTRFGRTAILWAVANRQMEVLKALSRTPANFEATDRHYGRTALVYAAWKRQIDAVQILLKSKVNVHAKDDFNRSAVDRAILNEDSKILEEFIKYATENDIVLNGLSTRDADATLSAVSGSSWMQKQVERFLELKSRYEEEEKTTRVMLMKYPSHAGNISRNTFNVLLLGDTYSGKTCFVDRLLERPFNPHMMATIGLNFGSIEFEVDGHSASLRIWDTSGIRRHRQVALSYCRLIDCCVIVFEMTQQSSFDSLSEWRKDFLVKRNLEESTNFPFVIVANKIDINENQRAVSSKCVIRFCQSIGASYIETSAKDGTNVDEAFEGVARQCLYGS